MPLRHRLPCSVKIAVPFHRGYVIEPARSTTSTRLAALFPPQVRAAEMRGAGDEAALMPAEASTVARAVVTRRQEFAAGRACARLLLREFGVVDYPLLVAEDRRPLWPEGLVGSISHTEDFCAVVVAESKCFLGVGIDTEVSGRVKRELWKNICTVAEIAWLESLAPSRQGAAATLLFSAKEAFYKAQYPVTGQYLNFHDASVEVAWDAEGGSFAVDAPNAVIGRARGILYGRFLVHEDFVTTGLAL